MIEGLVIICLVLGTILILIASYGILRMPDIFIRMSASTKASTAGVALCLAGAAIYFSNLATTALMLVMFSFLLFTAPLGAHIIGRAAYRKKIDLYPGTIDELNKR